MEARKDIVGIVVTAYVWMKRKELEGNIEGLTQWLVDHHDASIDAVRHVRDLLNQNKEALDLLNKKSI